MVAPRGWARCLDNVADVLRRGAWYPIIDETSDGKVVIEVRQKPVRLSRIDVTVRETRSEEHTSELQSLAYLVCRLLLEKKTQTPSHQGPDKRRPRAEGTASPGNPIGPARPPRHRQTDHPQQPSHLPPPSKAAQPHPQPP